MSRAFKNICFLTTPPSIASMENKSILWENWGIFGFESSIWSGGFYLLGSSIYSSKSDKIVQISDTFSTTRTAPQLKIGLYSNTVTVKKYLYSDFFWERSSNLSHIAHIWKGLSMAFPEWFS